MNRNLSRCTDLILESEGGWVNDPAGGPTNMGVTLAALRAWRNMPLLTSGELRMMDRTEAARIFDSQYADKVSFDDLPSGLDYCLFDCAVNSGPGRATILLQEIVGTVADGIMGAKTIAAVHAQPDTMRLIAAYSASRLAFMQSLRNWGPNADGWTTRVARVQHDAQQLAGMLPLLADRPAVILAPTKATGPVKITATSSGRAALASVGSVIVTAGIAAGQASAVLQPYVDMPVIKYGFFGLVALAALGTFIVAFQRAQSGATT